MPRVVTEFPKAQEMPPSHRQSLKPQVMGVVMATVKDVTKRGSEDLGWGPSGTTQTDPWVSLGIPGLPWASEMYKNNWHGMKWDDMALS